MVYRTEYRDYGRGHSDAVRANSGALVEFLVIRRCRIFFLFERILADSSLTIRHSFVVNE